MIKQWKDIVNDIKRLYPYILPILDKVITLSLIHISCATTVCTCVRTEYTPMKWGTGLFLKGLTEILIFLVKPIRQRRCKKIKCRHEY